MATEALSKLSPHRTFYLRGFDRRGAAAALTQTSSSGWTVSGRFSDQFDFAVLVIFDADDVFGHLYTTKYLPSFSLNSVVLDVDLVYSGCQSLTSYKFQSVPWGSLSWITSDATTGLDTGSGTTTLQPYITSVSGMTPASQTYTVNGAPVAGDVVYLIYLGNVQISYTVAGGDTTGAIANAMAVAVNAQNYIAVGSTFGLIATVSGSTFTVYCAIYGTVNTSGTAVTWVSGQNFLDARNGDPIAINGVLYTISTVNSPTSITLTGSAGTQTGVQYAAPGGGRDGNAIELYELHTTATTYLTPANASKLTGGTNESTLHLQVDFSALGLSSVRQLWFTFAPEFNYDSSAGNSTLVAYSPSDWSVVATNWSLSDPSSKLPLKIAGPGSQVVGSRNAWASYSGAGWQLDSGFFFEGFAKHSSTSTNSVTIKYSCQSTHDVYIGTSLYVNRGKFSITFDGAALSDLDMYLDVGNPLQTRRLIKSSASAGTHTVVLTVKSTANPSSTGTDCYFDYLHAAVASDVQDPAATYSGVGTAFDYDTDQTYKLSPQRSLFIARRAGFLGDIDFFGGVFFALLRTRFGGDFHVATVTLGGTVVAGDAYFVDVGGTAFGVGVTSADTLTTLAQRGVNAINSIFTGVRAAPTGTPGQFTITVMSPINGFSLSVTPGATLTASVSGDIGVTVGSATVGGQEGVWYVDDSAGSPLNQGFIDFLTDFCAELLANSMTATFAWSQELLGPPDVNTSADAWSARFPSGSTFPVVLTATGFGSWGAGFVESVAGSAPVTVTQTAHGYTTGYLVHMAGVSTSAVWRITVTGADTYELTTLISGSHTPAANNAVFAELQTTQCAFNPSTVTAYLENVYIQTASIIDGAGLTPWLQFGEVGHWFFSYDQAIPIGFVSFTNPISIGTSAAHGLSTGQNVLIAGVRGNTNANGLHAITVTDSTHFTLDGTVSNGAWVTNTGTWSGGGMAYYDANQTAAAVVALGRALASFWTQDDDPTINSGADAAFLQDRISDHTDAIVAAVLAAVPSSKFEVLWPYDVNFSTVYYTNDLPYPQGGRLNRGVNLPPSWQTKVGSNFDRFKIEALSWGAQYRNLDNAKTTITYPFSVLSWAKADSACLVPWFNGGCFWPTEWLYANGRAVPLINFWAYDQMILLSWRLPPLPANKRGGILF